MNARIDARALINAVMTETLYKTMSPSMKQGVLTACARLLKRPDLLSFDKTASGMNIAEWHNSIGHIMGDFVVLFKVSGGQFNVKDAFLTQFIGEDDEYDDD